MLINRITNVGWILDRTQSDLYPRFIQTAGPGHHQSRELPSRAEWLLTNANADNDRVVKELHAQCSVRLADVKLAGQPEGRMSNWRENSATDNNRGRRWNYIGTGPLPADPSLLMYDERKTGRHIPQWEARPFISERTPVDPALWREDLYFREQNKYTGTARRDRRR